MDVFRRKVLMVRNKLMGLNGVILFFSSVSIADDSVQSKFTLRGGASMVFANSTNINTAIDSINSLVSTLTMPHIGSIFGPSAGFGYNFGNSFELGLAFQYLSAESDSSDGTSVKISTGMTALQLKPRLFLISNDSFKFYFSPGIGVGWYSYSPTIVSGGTSSTLQAGGSGFIASGSVGIDLGLTDAVGLNFDAGYAYQQSPTLKANTVTGTAFPVSAGQNISIAGQSNGINLSGFEVAVGMIIHIPGAKYEDRPEPQKSPAEDKPSSLNASPSDQPVKVEDTNIGKGREPQSIREDSLESKLNRLQKMKNDGLITDKEYQEQRTRLLNSF